MSESSRLGRSLKGDPDWELEFRLIWGFERKDPTPEQSIGMLPEAGGRLSQGEKIGKICRGLGISEESYYRWRWTESRPGDV